MARLAVFGDSTVTRMYRSNRGDLRMPKGVDVRFFGVPDMTTRRKFQEAFNRMLDYEPYAVFLNLGGNDIDGVSTPAEIVDRLQAIVHTLHENGVVHVFVASIIHRSTPRYVSASVFDEVRKTVNRRLVGLYGRHLVDVMRKLKYPQHYDRDGVHPGEREGGLRKLAYMVRRCFFHALNNPSRGSATST